MLSNKGWELESGDERLPYGELAVLEEMITREQLNSLLYQQRDRRDTENKNVRIGTLLVREGHVSKKEAKALLKIQKAYGPIEGYQLLEHLGSGGMGSVFRAIEEASGRELAVKILPPSATRDSRYRARFLREAALLQQLDHPHLVRAYSSGESNTHLYFAMELVEGGTAREEIKQHGPFAESRVRTTLAQCLRAMEHYWEARIVHRDIKPENIMVTPDGVAKLMDLGLSRQLDDDVHITRVGKTLGTPLYISPELARGKSDIDIRSDLYSLGATFYHLACGVAPFNASSQGALLKAHVEDLPVRPRLKNPRMSDGMEAILLKLLAKRPDDRFATPSDVLEALDRLERGLPPIVIAPVRRSPTPTNQRAISARSASRPASARRRAPGAVSSATRPGYRKPTARRARQLKTLMPVAVGLAFLGLFSLGVLLGSRGSGEAASASTEAGISSAAFVKLAERDPVVAAEEALAFAGQDVVDPAEAVFRLRTVLPRVPTAEVALAARVEAGLKGAERRLEERARTGLEKLRTRIGKLVEQGKLEEARRELEAFPRALREAKSAHDGYAELQREFDLVARVP